MFISELENKESLCNAISKTAMPKKTNLKILAELSAISGS